jgi:CheY-like chemotaxis protein
LIRILLIEDNAVNRRVLGAMIRAGGFEMDEAEDGPAGLRRIDDADFDLVLMDLRMPGMDGVTAIRNIRARNGRQGPRPDHRHHRRRRRDHRG